MLRMYRYALFMQKQVFITQETLFYEYSIQPKPIGVISNKPSMSGFLDVYVRSDMD